MYRCWLCAALLAGCGRLGFGGEDRDAATLGDVLTPYGEVCHTGAWSAPQPIGINTTSEERGPSLTPDGLTLYFMSNRTVSQMRALWQATRASAADSFGSPTIIAELDSSADEGEPEIASNNLTLYFSSKRVANREDIFWATRLTAADPWVDQGPIVINGDPTTIRSAPSLSPEELTLYYIGSLDIHVATRATTSDTFTWVRELTELDAPQTEAGPSVTADGLEIFFESFRSGTGIIYTATRASTSDTWSAPVALPELSTSGSSWGAPEISADGRTLYFYVNVGQIDLYTSNRSCD